MVSITQIRAAARRYRFGPAATVAVGLYLAAAVVAVVVAAVSGDVSALSVVATAGSWSSSTPHDWLGPLLAVICGLNAWALWQVLRGPASPAAADLPRDVVWLRRLLYAGVAGELVLWHLAGAVGQMAGALVWTATVILLMRVVSGVSATFRAVTGALGVVGLPAAAAMVLPGEDFAVFVDGVPAIGWLGLTSLVCMVMVLLAQRRDGRWSDATVDIGRIALVAPLILPVVTLAFPEEWQAFDGPGLVIGAFGVFNAVWLARTAHELTQPPALPIPEATTGPAGTGTALPDADHRP